MHIPATFRPHRTRSKKVATNPSANGSSSSVVGGAATPTTTTLSPPSSSSSSTTTATANSETKTKNGALLLLPEFGNETSGETNTHTDASESRSSKSHSRPASKLASRPVSSISTNGKPPLHPSPLRQINIHSATADSQTKPPAEPFNFPPSSSSTSSASSASSPPATPMAGDQLISTSSPRSTKTGETTLNATSSSASSTPPPLAASYPSQVSPSSPPPPSPPLGSSSSPSSNDSSSQVMKSKQAARFANLLLNFKLASDLTNKPPDVRHTTSAGTSAFHGRPPAVDMQLFHKPQINERALGPNHSYQSNLERVIVTNPQQGYFDPLSDLSTNESLVQRIASEHITLPTLDNFPTRTDSNFQMPNQAGLNGGFGPSITTTPTTSGNFTPNNNLFLSNTNQIPPDFSSLEASVSHQPVIYVSPETLLRAQKTKAIFELKYDLIYSFQGSTAWLGQGVDIPRTDKGLPIFTQYNPLQTIRNRRYRPRFTAGANAYNNDGSLFDSALPPDGNSSGSSHGSISHLYHKNASQGRKTNPDFSMTTFFWNIDVYELFSDLNWRVVQYSLMRDRFGRHVFPSSKPDPPDNTTNGNDVYKIDSAGDQSKLSQVASAADDFAFETSLSKLSDDLESRTNSLALPPSTTVASAASHHLIHHHHHYNYHPSSNGGGSSHHLPSAKPVFSKIQDKLRQNFSSNSSTALNTNLPNAEGTGADGSKTSDAYNKHERILPAGSAVPAASINPLATASAGTEVPLAATSKAATMPVASTKTKATTVTTSSSPPSSSSSSSSSSAAPVAPAEAKTASAPIETITAPKPLHVPTPEISDTFSHLRPKSATPEVSEATGIPPYLSKKLVQQSSSPNLTQHMATATALATSSPKKPSKLNNNTLNTEDINRRHSMFHGSPDPFFPEQLKTSKDIHIESVRQRLQEQSALNNTASVPDSSVMPSLTQPLTPVLLVNDQKIESTSSEPSLYKKDTNSSNALDSTKIPEIYVSEHVPSVSDEGSTSTAGSVLLRPISNSPNTSGLMLPLSTNASRSSTQLVHKKKLTKQEQRQIMEQHKEHILELYSSELNFLELVFLLRYISITRSVENFNKGQSTRPMSLIYGHVHGKSDDSILGASSDDASSVSPLGSVSGNSGSTNNISNGLGVSSINGSSTLSIRKLVPASMASTASTTPTITPVPSLMPSVSKSKFPGPPGAAAVAAATAAGHKSTGTAAATATAAAAPTLSSQTAYAMSHGQPLMIPAAVQEREARQLVEDIVDTTSGALKDSLPRVRSALSDFESQMSTARRTRISTTSTRLDSLLAHSDQTLNRLSTTLAIEVKKVSERMDNLERSLGPRGGLFGLFGFLGSPYPRRFVRGRAAGSRPGRGNRRRGRAGAGSTGSSNGDSSGGGLGSGKAGKKSGGGDRTGNKSSVVNGRADDKTGEDSAEEDEEDEEEEEELDMDDGPASKAFRVFSGGPRVSIATPSMTTRIGYVLLEYTLVMLMWIIWGCVAILLRIKKVALFFWVIFRWFFWC